MKTRLLIPLLLTLVAGLSGVLMIPEAAAQPRVELGLTLTSLGNGQVGLTGPAGIFGGNLRAVRITPTGRTVLPSQDANTTVDMVPPELQWACYGLESIGEPRGVTPDLLCTAPYVASGPAPRNLTIGFEAACRGAVSGGRTCVHGWGTAILSWDPAPGVTSYVLVPLGTQRVQELPGSAQTAMDKNGGPGGGQLTCYLLVARNGQSMVGYGDIVCGAPPAG